MGEDRFMFLFENVYDMKKKVISRGLWSFDRHLIVLRTVGRDEIPAVVDLNVCDFHI